MIRFFCFFRNIVYLNTIIKRIFIYYFICFKVLNSNKFNKKMNSYYYLHSILKIIHINLNNLDLTLNLKDFFSF